MFRQTMFSTLIAAAMVVVASGCTKDPAAAATIEPVTLHFQVKGMHCEGCVNAIEGTTVRMDGVQEVVVSLEEETADITVTRTGLDESLRKAIEDLGYEATLVPE